MRCPDCGKTETHLCRPASERTHRTLIRLTGVWVVGNTTMMSAQIPAMGSKRAVRLSGPVIDFINEKGLDVDDWFFARVNIGKWDDSPLRVEPPFEFMGRATREELEMSVLGRVL